jgi:hypothetical protein
VVLVCPSCDAEREVTIDEERQIVRELAAQPPAARKDYWTAPVDWERGL